MQDSLDDPMGIGGFRLFNWLDRRDDPGPSGQVFILTHDVPDEPLPGSVRYVTDVGECAAQAREAAGDGDVTVMGAGAAQALLRAGGLDELELHVVPVLLGRDDGSSTTCPPSTSSSAWNAA